MSKPADILRARKALCLRIAEELERHFRFDLLPASTDWDVDEAMAQIDMMLPLAYAEAEAAWEETTQVVKEGLAVAARGPGLSQQIRAALGHGEKDSLKMMLEGCLWRIERCKQAEALLRECARQGEERYLAGRLNNPEAVLWLKVKDFVEGK